MTNGLNNPMQVPIFQTTTIPNTKSQIQDQVIIKCHNKNPPKTEHRVVSLPPIHLTSITTIGDNKSVARLIHHHINI